MKAKRKDIFKGVKAIPNTPACIAPGFPIRSNLVVDVGMMSMGGSSPHETRRHFLGERFKVKDRSQEKYENIYLGDGLTDGTRGEMIHL